VARHRKKLRPFEKSVQMLILILGHLDGVALRMILITKKIWLDETDREF
jgi:hypothetical protein